MSIFSINVAIAISFAWAYLNEGSQIVGVAGFLFLMLNFFIQGIMCWATFSYRRSSDLNSVMRLILMNGDMKHVESEKFKRFLKTIFGLISSWIAGLVIVASGFNFCGISYMTLSALTMWSIASFDDQLREYAKKNKIIEGKA